MIYRLICVRCPGDRCYTLRPVFGTFTVLNYPCAGYQQDLSSVIPRNKWFELSNQGRDGSNYSWPFLLVVRSYWVQAQGVASHQNGMRVRQAWKNDLFYIFLQKVPMYWQFLPCRSQVGGYRSSSSIFDSFIFWALLVMCLILLVLFYMCLCSDMRAC